MRYYVYVALFLLVLMIGCSKEEASITGMTTAGNAAETSVTIPENLPEQKSDGGCTDSDGGLTKETAGKVTGVLNGEEYTVYDRCIAGLLIEYFCEGNTYQNQNLRCPEGTRCVGGACRSL